MNRESTLSSTGYGYDEGLRKFSSTFDQIIWDWENGK